MTTTSQAPNVSGLGDDVVAEDAGPARRRPHQRGQDPQGRGLAGTVGPEQAEDRVAADVEAQTVDRGRVSAPLRRRNTFTRFST
jgi:hypothetical protein